MIRPSPLQNRVAPAGELAATRHRGTWMGNRGGRIHDPRSKRLSRRRWANRAWICCKLEFNNRHRVEIMGPGYTEMFFLDEVTALAAGHRPCFECRRRDAELFLNLHAESMNRTKRLPAAEFDRLAQADRLVGREKRTYTAALKDLPCGTMVLADGQACALHEKGLLRWSFSGYDAFIRGEPGQAVDVLTPEVFVAVLSRGYAPHWHETANSVS